VRATRDSWSYEHSKGLECGALPLLRMDLTGHHSNPSRPLEALLACTSPMQKAADRAINRTVPDEPARAAHSVAAEHRRHDWVLAAVIEVLEEHGVPMQARDVHLAVEEILGMPVRWSSVKACLAANVAEASPRFVRLAPGRYELRGYVRKSECGRPRR
jgi:hypothetical protein